MERNMKIGLALVAMAFIVASGALVAIRLFAPTLPFTDGSSSIRILDGENEVELTLQQLTTMNPIQGDSSFQNQYGNWKDFGTYVGPRLSTLIEVMAPIDEDDVVLVTASDGYPQYFAYYNLYPNTSFYAFQGDLILAHSYNGTFPGTTLAHWQDGPRIAFLPPDGAYSNNDAAQTTHPAWFRNSGGARWNRNVANITILRDVYFGGFASIQVIDGDYEKEIYWLELALMDTLQSTSAYQKGTGTWEGNGTYVGPLLSTILEVTDPITEQDTILVTASDGWTQYYAFYNLYPNTSIHMLQGDLVLAYSFNGTTIPAWVDGPRIAFLAPDNAYSNADAEHTTHPTWFRSAGARWNKNVANITILRDSYPPSRSNQRIITSQISSGASAHKAASFYLVGRYDPAYSIEVIDNSKLIEVR